MNTIAIEQEEIDFGTFIKCKKVQNFIIYCVFYTNQKKCDILSRQTFYQYCQAVVNVSYTLSKLL